MYSECYISARLPFAASIAVATRMLDCWCMVQTSMLVLVFRRIDSVVIAALVLMIASAAVVGFIVAAIPLLPLPAVILLLIVAALI
jgi:hypothetical protein